MMYLMRYLCDRLSDRGVVCGVKKWTAYVRKFDCQGDQDDCHQPKPLKEERL